VPLKATWTVRDKKATSDADGLSNFDRREGYTLSTRQNPVSQALVLW
jgi:hypothetical protein